METTCVHQQMMDQEKTDNRILFNQKRGANSAICSNVTGPSGIYAKLNKPDREREILYGIAYMQTRKNDNR